MDQTATNTTIQAQPPASFRVGLRENAGSMVWMEAIEHLYLTGNELNTGDGAIHSPTDSMLIGVSTVSIESIWVVVEGSLAAR